MNGDVGGAARRGGGGRAARLALAAVLVGAAVVLGVPSLTPGPGDRPGVARPALAEGLRMPVRFEPNLGQAAPEVEFVARHRGSTLSLTRREAVLTLAGIKEGPQVLRMAPVAPDRQPRGRGLDLQPGVSNYFVGRDTSRWRTGVPGYARVAYTGVWAGIDLVYHADRGALEYDAVVAPGADPDTVGFTMAGARSLAVGPAGELVITTESGAVVRQPPPVLYQEGPHGRRQPIDGGYRLGPGGRLGFRVGDYDERRPLVIDPVLAYFTYLGGDGQDLGLDLAVDGSGHVYLAGTTSSTDFPSPVSGGRSGGGVDDAFVAKLDTTKPGPGALMWATYIGGANDDEARAVAVGAAGAVTLVGKTDSPDMPSTPGVMQPNLAPGPCDNEARKLCDDAFVAGLGPGGGLSFLTYLGGPRPDGATGVALDAQANIYLAATADGPFPVTRATAYQPDPSFHGDAVVAKLAPGAAGILYGTYLGGSGQESTTQIAIGAAGSAYVTGSTHSRNFPTTAGAFDRTYNDGNVFIEDAFVAKIDTTQAGPASLVYSTYLGGSNPTNVLTGGDYGADIAVDAAGHAYVTGRTTAADFPVTPDAFQAAISSVDRSDAFVTVFNPAGSALVYSTFLGGKLNDTGSGIAIDGAGRAVVTGYTDGAGFPVTPDAFQPAPGGVQHRDAFVARVDPLADGAASLPFSSFLGGTEDDVGTDLALDPTSGDVLLTGHTASAELAEGNPYDATCGTDTAPCDDIGNDDAFLARVHDPSPENLLVPVVTGVAPDNGPTAGGTPVTISGRGFTAATAVDFGDAAAPVGWKVVSDTQVTATSPLHAAGPVHVTVTTKQAKSATSGLDVFTYRDPAPPPPAPEPPVVSAISPDRGPVAGGTEVAVTGSGFAGATAVHFGATAVTTRPCPPGGGGATAPCFVEHSPTAITVYSPAAGGPGAVHVRVQTPAGTSAATAADLFEYYEGAPPVAPPEPGGPEPGGTTPPGAETPPAAPPGSPTGAAGPGPSAAPGPGGAPGAGSAPTGAQAPTAAHAPGASAAPQPPVAQTPSPVQAPVPTAGGAALPGAVGVPTPGMGTVGVPGFGTLPTEASEAAPRHAMVAHQRRAPLPLTAGWGVAGLLALGACVVAHHHWARRPGAVGGY